MHFFKSIERPPTLLGYTCLMGGLLLMLNAAAQAAEQDEVQAQEQQQEPENLWDMPVEELANIPVQVTVASNRAESIPSTPAIVSRYDRETLERMGIRSLTEMLSLVPGIVITNAHHGHQIVMIRGLAESFNQKVLFLIDDVPYWIVTNSDIPLLGVPFEAIDHIEVIRGPGSVYYGTNASAGVIRVVTRRDLNGSLALMGGGHDLYRGGGYFGTRLAENATLTIAAEKQHDDGYDAMFENLVSAPRSGLGHHAENYYSVLTRLEWDGITLGAQLFDATMDGIFAPASILNQGQSEYNGYLLTADFQKQMDKAQLRVFTDYNQFAPEFRIEKFFGGAVDANVRYSNNGEDNFRWRLGSNLDYRFDNSLGLFVGAEYEYRSAARLDAVPLADGVPSRNINLGDHLDELSLLGQLDYTHKDWRFLLGARWVDNERSGSNFMPRLAAIYRLDQQQSLKLLYSTGYNSPNFSQSSANSHGIVVAEATAETVKSLDLAYNHVGTHHLFVINGYYLTLDDPIERMFRNNQIHFGNGKEYNRYGAELDFQLRQDDWQLLFNLSYNRQGNRVIQDDLLALFVPRFTANLGVSYQIGPHSVAGVLRYVSDRATVDERAGVNLNYQYEGERYTLFLTLHNIFNAEMIAPDLVNLNNTAGRIPDGDDRGVLAGVRVTF